MTLHRQVLYAILLTLTRKNVLILAAGNPGYAGRRRAVAALCRAAKAEAASPRRDLPENHANFIISGQICLSINGSASMMKTDSKQTTGTTRRIVTLCALLLLVTALGYAAHYYLACVLTNRHLGWAGPGQGVRCIEGRYTVFLFFSAIALPYITGVRWFSRRNTKLDFWLFAVPVIVACLYLLTPLTCAFSMMIDYASTGITPKRIHGLLFGLGGYLTILGFLWWAVRKPRRQGIAEPNIGQVSSEGASDEPSM